MLNPEDKVKNALDRADLSELLEIVSITNMEDVHNSAVALRDIGDEYGFRIALCPDISSRDPIVDAENTVLNADVFGWGGHGERWWGEQNALALHSPIVRACRYEAEPFWCNKQGIYGHRHNPYIEGIDTKTYFDEYARYSSAILIPLHLPFGQISANSYMQLMNHVPTFQKNMICMQVFFLY